MIRRGKIRQVVKASLKTIYDASGHFWGYSYYNGEPKNISSRKKLSKLKRQVKNGTKIQNSVVYSDPNNISSIGSLEKVAKENIKKPKDRKNQKIEKTVRIKKSGDNR
jgi:hypothetical protein